jgi:hypothetical protein
MRRTIHVTSICRLETSSGSATNYLGYVDDLVLILFPATQTDSGTDRKGSRNRTSIVTCVEVVASSEASRDGSDVQIRLTAGSRIVKVSSMGRRLAHAFHAFHNVWRSSSAIFCSQTIAMTRFRGSWTRQNCTSHATSLSQLYHSV